MEEFAAAMLAKAKRAWSNMKQRCYSESNGSYKHYGGRGIRVSDACLGSFARFLADVGLPPSPAHSIDRIDNDGNYEAGNCRWATARQQNRNRQTTLTLVYQRRRVNAAAWAEMMAIPYSYVFEQVFYHRRTGEKILERRHANRAMVEAQARSTKKSHPWKPGRKPFVRSPERKFL